MTNEKQDVPGHTFLCPECREPFRHLSQIMAHAIKTGHGQAKAAAEEEKKAAE